ncbi:protein piccolo isoform 4-T4 [Pluvialis apricaria]
MMPSFLSDANPLSAVTSVVNKFNPFDLISDSDAAHEEAGRKQKVTQKEQGKPEEQRGLAKHPAQQQSPKPAVQQQGPVRSTPQTTESSKPVPQQQQPGEPKQVQKPGPGHPADSKLEQAKQPPQPRGPQKSQPQQSEPTKPVQQQTSSKPSSGPPKPSAQQPDNGRTSSQAPPPSKPSSQQPGPVKQPSQQPARQGGPVKPSSQQAGPPKQPSQQPGPEKPSAQQTGPAKQPSQPGPGKPPPQQTGLVKQVPPQAGPAKPSSQAAGAAKPPAQPPGLTKPPGQQPGPEKPTPQKQASASQPPESAPKKTFCPLCTTTELLLHAPEKANYNTCTQCHTVVCSLCGFNPNPHITEIKEWLCLNCQMQRALGGDLAPGPGPQPPPPKQKTPLPPSTAKPYPQPQPVQKKDVSPKPDPSQLAESKKTLPQKKQPSLPGSPPVKSKQPRAEPAEISQQIDPTPKPEQAKPTQAEDKQNQPSIQKPVTDTVPTSAAPGPKQDSAGPRPPPTQQKVTDSPKPEVAKPSQDTHPAGDKPDSKPLPQVSRQKSDPKLASQPGAKPDAKTQKPVEPTQTKDDPKKLQTKPAPKPDTKPAPKGPQAGTGPKPAPPQLAPQPQPPQKTPEQSRRFSLNLGGITDAPKPQPTTPQETVTGKLFGFGASIFSQASNLISTAGQPGSQTSAPPPAAKQPQPPSQPPASQAAPKEAGQAQPPPKAVPVKKEAKPLMTEKSEPSKADSVLTTKGSDLEKKPGLAKDGKPQAAEAKKPAGLSEPEKASQPKVSCPLCKTGLNIGSKDPPNFNTCTECKKVVCNLCGFNPMPHIAEVQEWLCLNCQTQRAMSGQLGDMGKVPLPKTGPSQPASKPPASPQKQPVPAVSHSPQKTSTPPTPAAAKPKEEPGVQKEAPKLQQRRLEKTSSADKIQQGIQKEDAKLKQGKLVKAPSADKIQRVSQKEDPRIQQTKLIKTPSADKILHGVQKEDAKFQEAKMAKTSSADKILHGVQKEDIKLQEAKLAKIPSADKILHGIQKEDPKLQQVKMAKALSADKIQPAAQKEDEQLQEVKLPKAVSVDKIQHGIQKEDPKLQQEKIMKTSSVEKIQEEAQKEESKLQQGKLSKALSADKMPATISSDQKKPLSTLEEDKTVLPEKSRPHPEDKKEQITAETKDHVAEQKAEVEAPYKGLQAKKQEDVKKEGLTTGISQMVLKAEKPQAEEMPVQAPPLPRTDHVEAVREKIEKEDDKSDTSSYQQQKSPQGLSDTGYSSDGISSSLGEIPSHIPSDEKDLPKESSKKDTISQESPPSPSDLAKLESTVLSILEAQASTLSDEKSVKSKELYEMYSEQTKDQHKTKPLPVTPESYSSDEEDSEAIQEGERTIVEDGKGSTSSRADYKEEEEGDDISARRQRYDSVEDSSESENSPVPRRKRRASVGSSSSDEYKRDDSQGSGDEEDFIRKQIIEMSADEDASGSEDDEFIRNQLKEISVTESQKKDEVKSKVKGTAGKHRRMARKSSAGYDEDAGRRHSWHDDDDETFDESPEPKYRETKSQDSEELAVTGGGGLRRFKTIELNSTITNKYSEASEQQKGILYFDEEPELEMESLTDSPEDRSRGEGSSSLHASSFTPGTSPTSVSSLDEDSDSSPSHKKLGGESKQQRKARHRSHGPLLPTIEDSSEEEELREEEELLKEQEKQRELEQQQRKSSSKKSKKDKDELRAQRRRERPKTPPSNLSPIEDASPTEELRQAAEMEELHRSSCSEYSPSIESDPEGFEISPEKIIEVQKVYKLPTAVSLYSPTDEQSIGLPKEESGQKTLKSAEEVYEEMMHKTHKSKPFQIANEKDEVFEKESLYGGMLIEDYIYESLVEDTYNGSIDTNLVMRQDESNEYIQQRGKEKKIGASEQIYEEPQKITDLQKDYYSVETLHSIVPQEDIVSSSYIIPESHEIVVLDSTVTSTTEEKQLLDAEAAYEELMKRQKMQLTPGSSPTQPASGFIPTSDTKVSSVGEIVDSTSLTSSTTSAISDVSPVSSAALSIPDVKITQHFTAEEIEDEYLTDYAREIQEIISHETSMLTYSETLEGAASVLPSDTASLTSSTSSVCTTDSSSPVDSATTSYVDTADAVSKLADSEGGRIIPQVPLTSTKEYSEVSMPYESVAGATKKPSIESDMESVDQAAVCLPETAPSVVATTVIEPKQYATDTITFDTSKAEKEAAKKIKSTVEAGIVKIHHEDLHKELGFDMTRIHLTSATSEQPPVCIASVPVTEPASETSSVPTPSVVSKTSMVSVPSSAPAVTSKVFSLFRSSSLDSPAQPSPPLPPPPPPPPPPPLPPPILPKPAIYPKKKSQIKTPATTAPTVVPSVTSVPTLESSAVLKNHVVPITKTHTPTPPPVPPKPSSIPAGLVFSHRPTEVTKPPIAPKPAVPPLPIAVHKPAETQPKPIGLSLTSSMTLNLVSAAEYKIASPTSPLSPHSNKSSPRLTKPSQETYVVITLPSEPGTPTEAITSQAVTSWPLEAPSKEHVPQPMQPIFTPSKKTMEIQSMADQSMYISGALQAIPVTTPSTFEKIPSSKSEVVTSEVTKTTVSVVKGPVPGFGLGSVAITIPPEPLHIVDQPRYRENGRFHPLGDVIDLRTLTKMDIEMRDSCMDLSAVSMDVRRQMPASDSCGRPVSTVQPAIINLSTACVSDPSLPVVTETVAVMTCTATVSYSASTDSLVDLGHAMTTPLQLTTSKHFEPVYRVTGRQAFSEGRDEVPINLSLGTSTHAVTWATTKPVTVPPVGVTNGWTDLSTSQEPMESGAVDLSTTKSHRTVVTMDETTSGIITTVIEDDEKPVDLTAGRRAVCCDMVYKLPFGRSCTAQQPPTTLPEDRFGYRDDHYQYDRSGSYGYRGIGGMKPSMSDTNLSEAGLFAYKSKNSFDYRVGATDAAVDLTSGRVTTGEVMDYSSKTTGPYPETRQVISGIGLSTPQYSQARMVSSLGSQFGVGSVLRSSNGVVYSSVATPIPSTFAITTQPGSIFSTTVRDLPTFQTIDSVPSLSTLQQNQPLPRSYSFLTTVAAEKDSAITAIDMETGLQPLTIETITTEPTNLIPALTTASEVYTDVIEDEVALLIAPEEGKQQQLDLERELLELEKIKQQRFAEELEWERQEIQRFREQEKFMVQKKLEELQSMKHHLLFQQEEERQAQFMMRQETLAQQQLQLEQFQQLQQQLHQQLEEQKIRQIYQYGYDPSGTGSPQTTTDQTLLEGHYATTENGQFWPTDDATTTASGVLGIEIPQSQTWYTVQSEGITQYIPRSGILSSVSEMSLKDIDVREEKQLKKRSSMPKLRGPYEELEETLEEEPRCFKKIVDSGVQTDDEDGADRGYTNRRRRTKKSVDTSVQTDDEDQDEWDLSSRSRRKPRVGKYSESTTEVDKAKPFSKVSSIAVQTVAEISVQTEPVGTIRTPSIRARLDAKVEIIKHISAPEKTYKGESLGCQTETESDSPQYLSASSPQKDKKRPTPLEIGYASHLRPDSTLQVVPSPPKSPKVLYSPISPVSPSKVIESAFVPYEKPITDDISPQKMLHADIAKVPPSSPKAAKMMQRSMSDPKPLSPTAEDSSRAQFQYTEGFMTKGSSSITPSGTQKKVKRTLPNPPPEEATAGTQSPYTSVGSVSRRRICRTNTMARAKILQDIDRELDLVERESAKLRKKQAELDEEEKEIDAKLRYLEMGINRRKEALLKEREKRERAYLQGVAEERDYMSDSEVNNTRSTRIETQHGLERPRTAPQTEFNQFMPPQTQPETQFAPATSPYAQYQYSSPALPTQAPTQFTQQSHYQQQQPLYHQQVSPYQTQTAFQTGATMSFTPQAQPPPSQQPSYQLPSQMMVIQPKSRQTTLYLEPKITTNYDVIRNQPLMIAPVSTDNNYAVSQLGSKYSTLDLRIGLDERNSIASSPISSISADSFYADIDHHHTPRNYVLIDDIGELTKGTGALGSSFSLHEKDLTKTDRLLRTTEARRAQEVTDFLAPLQTSSRLHSYVKADEDPMEDPYELKLLKHQIKQEFRRGAESLDHLAGLSQYYHAEGSYRHFPKSEKYSIGRLTLEKQAAKQLPAALLYQKQSKHKKALIDPKLTKFSPIQESRDLEPDYSSYMTSSTSTLGGITTRARLLQDDITFGLRKNITDQQKYMGPPLTSSIGAGLGTALGPTMRSALQDEADKSYSSGSRSRPSSRPSSVYGLDLSLKRDSSSSSLRLKAQEAEPLDVSFSHAAPSGRTKPTSLPISQSRGRIPIVAQNSEEESPLSPVGQPMGMARAAAGPLPPISADTRDQFGSSHSLPEVQQHMREESRTRGYDRDIAFIMDDFQHAMSDSEAYHLRREETDWFDKPRESRLENGHGLDRRLPEKLSHSRPPSQHQDQINGKPLQYIFPHARLKLLRDPKDHTVSGNGLGIRVVGGKEIPGSSGEIGAYIAKILPGGNAEQTGKLIEGMQVLEWNGIPLTGKTYEEVQSIIIQQSGEAEICVRLDLNMLSDSENPQHLELHEPVKAVDKAKSPGVDPKQLAAELQKVSLQQSPLVASSGVEKGSHVHSGTTSAASSAVPSPGQPGSPSVSKKRHSSKPAETTKSASHPITGEIQLQINYDKHLGNLIIHILQARNLAPRDNNGYSDPFVKVYLLPGRGQVMVVQNASAEYKRRTKYVQKSLNPEWNQTVIYKNISMEQLKKKTLEVTVWDYDRFSSNDFLGEVLIELSSVSQLDNTPRWYPLKEQSENIDHGKSHSGQSSQQSPKPSVIKSRSHGIFPDPSKDMQVPTIEKSHSSPGSSKSSSEGHLRSHGPSRSQSKTSVTQTHLEDAGAAIAAAEAAVQQLRLQPTAHKSGQSNHARKQHRHSIAGVLPIQRTQSDNLPPPASDNKDQSQLALRKVMSDGPVKPEGARSTNHRPAESSVSTGSSASSFGSGYSMDSEGSSSATGENNLFPIPRIGKMSQNGQEPVKQSGVGLTDAEGKTQVMGEIKIALKKEMKTDGEQLIVEILQCRNITYKFKSPDHLPDLYVKLYVVNISTQKRVIKKKTRVCRHDREPSFNETFRFSLSPAGHSLQILLVSNGGKFMKKTLIGEAYIWLDKVDLRKRIVNWHKLLVSSTQTH